MNIYVMNYLFFAFSVFLLSILILLKRGDDIARRWFYFSLVVVIWGVGYAFVADNSVNNETAFIAARIAQAGAAFISPAWFYFVIGFLDVKPRRPIFVVPWLVGFLLSSCSYGNLYVSSVGPIKGFTHFTQAGPLMWVQFLNFTSIVIYGFYLMLRAYRFERSRERKKEILSLIFATVFGFIGGASQFSVIFFKGAGIDLTLLASTYPFIMAYVMIRHHVLDIEKITDAFQKEKLAAIGILAASMNHEIKNPLYIAQGKMESFLQNLEDGIFQNGDAESAVRETIKTSLQQLRRASEIMQRLTNFAKPQVENDLPERVLLNGVVENVLELVNSELEARKIKLSREIEKNLTLLGNRRQFEEIFFNLIVNASQAMKDGGELTLCAERHNGSVRVEIKDQGLGIPSDQLSKIFQPFYTTKESGTGLGLYVTKQLVGRNGGKIRCESSSAGTRFCLEFAE